MDEVVLRVEAEARQCPVCGLRRCAAKCPGRLASMRCLEMVATLAGRVMHCLAVGSLEVHEEWSWSDQVELGPAGVIWSLRLDCSGCGDGPHRPS